MSAVAQGLRSDRHASAERAASAAGQATSLQHRSIGSAGPLIRWHFMDRAEHRSALVQYAWTNARAKLAAPLVLKAEPINDQRGGYLAPQDAAGLLRDQGSRAA